MSSQNASYRKSFGARLAVARKRADMNQAQLADWVGDRTSHPKPI